MINNIKRLYYLDWFTEMSPEALGGIRRPIFETAFSTFSMSQTFRGCLADGLVAECLPRGPSVHFFHDRYSHQLFAMPTPSSRILNSAEQRDVLSFLRQKGFPCSALSREPCSDPTCSCDGINGYKVIGHVCAPVRNAASSLFDPLDPVAVEMGRRCFLSKHCVVLFFAVSMLAAGAYGLLWMA